MNLIFYFNSLFSDQESYAFSGFEHPVARSDDEDLAYVVGKVNELGFDMYVRDVSYLGFPSYHVYIPGMSEVHFSDFHESMAILYGLQENRTALMNLKQAGAESIQKLELHLQGGDVRVVVNGSELPLTPFPNDIIANEVTAMVSSLKGIDRIENLKITVKVI